MIQPQWPGLGPILSPGVFGRSPLGDGTAGAGSTGATDGVGSSWWNRSTAVPGSGTTGSTDLGSMWTVLQQILGLVGQLVGAFTSNAGTTAGSTASSQQPANGGAQQRFADVDISSTGDPHLAESGTRTTANGTQQVDEQYDSMTGHDDLVSSRGVAGGYRVSTSVTQPTQNGVTWNDSATVHANFDQDAVTMQRDGSFSISDSGNAVALAKGQTVTLSGGETVAENADGSLVVSASNQSGGTIATTLRANGTGVDVSTHAHELAVGGDVVQHGRHAHHGGHHRPATGPIAAPPVAAPNVQQPNPAAP